MKKIKETLKAFLRCERRSWQRLLGRKARCTGPATMRAALTPILAAFSS